MKNVLSCIGNTPIVELNRFNADSPATIFAKLEMFNPTLSIKDRIILHIINKAEQDGRLTPGSTIIEATSGNTGASVAMIATIKGYKAIITTPAKTSEEKVNMIRSYGATVHVCPTTAKEGDAEHYITKAKLLNKNIPNSFYVNQYNNIENREAHYLHTAPELWEQMEGKIDYFVAGGSTGGTISGVGRFLKEKNPDIKVIMPDPVGSCYYDFFREGKINKDHMGPYQVEGVGKDFICDCIDFSVIDDVIQFTDEDAFGCAREMARTEGLLLGGSSGGALFVARKLAEKLNKPTNIVVICADAGIKYLSKIYIESK